MKNSRWVRVHEQDQAFEVEENVMDVVKGSQHNQAEVIYTANTRTIEKAVYWLLRYLGYSKAQKLLDHAHEEIEKAATATTKDDERMEASGEGWSCTIEKMGKGMFKVSMNWIPEIEPVEISVKKIKKEIVETQPEENLTAVETSTETQSEEIPQDVETSTEKKSKKKGEKAA